MQHCAYNHIHKVLTKMCIHLSLGAYMRRIVEYENDSSKPLLKGLIYKVQLFIPPNQAYADNLQCSKYTHKPYTQVRLYYNKYKHTNVRTQAHEQADKWLCLIKITHTHKSLLNCIFVTCKNI